MNEGRGSAGATSPAGAGATAEPELALSIVRGDASFRLQRALGLIPPGSLGVVRRAALLAAVTWLPIAIWAVLARRAFPGTVDEPLLQHFGIHIRCLVAIPLLVFAEALAHSVTTRLVPYFVDSGLVRDAERPRFVDTVRGVLRLRDASLPWAIIAGLVIAWTISAPAAIDVDELNWGVEKGTGEAIRFGFGAWWFFYVARPLYVALLLGWLWRLVLVFLLLQRISRLDLSLVPTHPDRAGGLAFLEALPSAFSLVTLAVSMVVGARWAHEVLYHGVKVATLRLPGIAFLIGMLILMLAPLLVFMPKLGALKRHSLLSYGALVGEHGRLVARRWIERDPSSAEEELLNAPEIGPVADAIALYEAVEKMRPAPIGMRALLAVAVPAALPILAVFAIEIPVRELIAKLLGTLV